MVVMEVKHLKFTRVKPEIEVQAKIPLTIFDRAAPDIHVAVLLVYNATTVSNTKLKLGLAKALAYYPILAGKLISDLNVPPVVILNHESCAPVIEASVAKNINDLLPLRSSPELTLLHSDTMETNPLLIIQLTRFEGGGLVIGVSWNHLIADGQSMSNFLIAWSQLVCGHVVKPLPIHDRSLLRPREPLLSEFPREAMEFSSSLPGDGPQTVEGDLTENLLVHYTCDFICRLKEKAGCRCCTFECLVSHLWKKITIARGLEHEQVTRLKVAVNGRSRMDIPPEYFGNLVLTAFPNTMVKELVQEDEGYAAKLIHVAVNQIGSQYFQSFVDFGELHKHKFLCPAWNYVRDANVLAYSDLEVDSWSGFKFHEVDMGGGSPSAFMPSWIREEGLITIMAANSKEKHDKEQRWSSGINVIITLFREHADTFKKIAYSID